MPNFVNLRKNHRKPCVILSISTYENVAVRLKLERIYGEGRDMGHVVIIGADRGIGEALARTYKAHGHNVTAVCHGRGKSHHTDDIRLIPDIDVTSDQAVASLAEQLEDQSIDELVHVSGVGVFEKWRDIDFDAMLDHYNLNALGPLRVVHALSDNFVAGGKIGIVTSRMGSIGDNQSGRMYSYRMSKAAANMLGVTLYHQFRPRGVAVILLHPGTVATAMTQGAKDWEKMTKPAEAAAGLFAQMQALGPDTPPEFRHQDGTLLPW